jgi:hypothetical protein
MHAKKHKILMGTIIHSNFYVMNLSAKNSQLRHEYDMINSYRHRDIVEFENYGSHVYDMVVITIVRQIDFLI